MKKIFFVVIFCFCIAVAAVAEEPQSKNFCEAVLGCLGSEAPAASAAPVPAAPDAKEAKAKAEKKAKAKAKGTKGDTELKKFCVNPENPNFGVMVPITMACSQVKFLKIDLEKAPKPAAPAAQAAPAPQPAPEKNVEKVEKPSDLKSDLKDQVVIVKQEEPKKEKKGSAWPYIIGGAALVGLGVLAGVLLTPAASVTIVGGGM